MKWPQNDPVHVSRCLNSVILFHVFYSFFVLFSCYETLKMEILCSCLAVLLIIYFQDLVEQCYSLFDTNSTNSLLSTSLIDLC